MSKTTVVWNLNPFKNMVKHNTFLQNFILLANHSAVIAVNPIGETARILLY
jgi:hypothetical protein